MALDARLEIGVETGVEIALRKLSTLGAYNLPLSINANIHVCTLVQAIGYTWQLVLKLNYVCRFRRRNRLVIHLRYRGLQVGTLEVQKLGIQI